MINIQNKCYHLNSWIGVKVWDSGKKSDKIKKRSNCFTTIGSFLPLYNSFKVVRIKPLRTILFPYEITAKDITLAGVFQISI